MDTVSVFDDVLGSLNDLGYSGPLLESDNLQKAIEGGPKSIEFTQVVAWLSNELNILSRLEEHVNAITDPEDASSFMLELSALLKEIGCPYQSMVEGPISQRILTKESRLTLLDFLCSEVQAARMIYVQSGGKNSGMQVKMQESSTAKDMKSMLIALGFGKPPVNITPAMLFSKAEAKIKEVLNKYSPDQVGKPLFMGVLTDKQWLSLEELQKQMYEEYMMRREVLLKRLDVTIQSFKWADRLKSKEDLISRTYQPRRQLMKIEPAVDLSDLLAAREDLAIIEKTSSASVRKNTQTAINKVLIGAVPDRGGRPEEQQPPPPEMPSWQKRSDSGHGGSFSGGRGGRGGGGSDRGGRVQGGWSDKGQSGWVDNRVQGGWSDNRGRGQRDGGFRGNYGNRGGNRGGYSAGIGEPPQFRQQTPNSGHFGGYGQFGGYQQQPYFY
ncbi:protein FAM98A isoform X1 [Tachypleus tridentatus]|uniref:protein FAM98A isoform X1 n=2 Tax=Tachypleus tridentatus TaxID=6853 RepID=UPI003FD4AA23